MLAASPMSWRHYSISSATFYNWKAEYGGLGGLQCEVAEGVVHENSRLKRMDSDLFLEKLALKDVIAKISQVYCAGGAIIEAIG